MPINVKCPYCEKVISARDDLAGKKADCPNCRTQLDIPKESWKPSGEDLEEPEFRPDESANYYIDSCPHCGKVISAPDERKWKRGRCPKCKCPMGKSPAELRRERLAAQAQLLQAKAPPAGFVGGIF